MAQRVIDLREVADRARLERAADALERLTGFQRHMAYDSLNRTFTQRMRRGRVKYHQLTRAANMFLDAIVVQASHIPRRQKQFLEEKAAARRRMRKRG